jgi:chromate reductase, NAD(P)H dehydrogenase (quinone)
MPLTTPHPIHLLAISGSLRSASSNTALLNAAIALAPEHVEIKLYNGLRDLPHFNPDLEPLEPTSVKHLRALIQWADGLIISSPEYAHGIPGVLKNALDWLVSSQEFPGKPVALFNASPRATHAQASLIEIITTMAGQVVPEACTTVALPGKHLDTPGIIADREIAEQVQAAITAYIAVIEKVPEKARAL